MEWQPAIEAFLVEVKSRETSSMNTLHAYKNDLAQLVDHLSQIVGGEGAWAAVTIENLESYIAQMTIKGYSNATIARKLAAVKTFVRWLMDSGYTQTNPAQRLASPKLTKQPPHLLTQTEVAHLIASAGAAGQPRALRDQALLSVLYSTGMRVSEVIRLKLSELDLENKRVFCRGRGKLQRHVPLTAQTVEHIANYLANGRNELIGSKPSDSVFLNPMGVGLTRQAVWMMIKHHAQTAKITSVVTPHTLRHSRASHMVNSGEDPRRVREWLGHANLSTTQSYISKAVISSQ